MRLAFLLPQRKKYEKSEGIKILQPSYELHVLPEGNQASGRGFSDVRWKILSY
jgi:hypothetical protein